MAIKTTANLAKAIQAIEAKRVEQKEGLVKEFNKTIESFDPVNLLKDTINQVTNSPGVKDNILNFSIGIGAGLATKKLLIGKPDSLLKKIIGGAVEFGVTNLVATNGGFIKAKGIQLLSQFLKRKTVK